MKNKLMFLKMNKQRFIALFVLLIMVLNACPNPITSNAGGSGGSNPGGSSPTDFTPIAFYVDENGDFSEMDLGRTIILADENLLDVVLYSDDAFTYQHVTFTFEDKNIIFFFEENLDFPTSMAVSDSEGSFNGFFTLYDPVTQTFGLTVEQGDDIEIWSNIALNKEIFSQYKNDPELTSSQNMRMRNLFIGMNIYLSLYEFVDEEDISARFIFSGIRWLARKIFPPRLFNVVNIVISAAQIATGIVLIKTPIGAAYIVEGTGNMVYSIITIIDEGNAPVSASSGPHVAVTGISLDRTSANIDIGNTVILKPSLTPSNATNKYIGWNSSDTAVAQIATNGTVIGLKEGTTTITVITADGNRTATCTVNVSLAPVSGVTLNKTSINIFVDGIETLVPTITPANAANKNVTWVSSNTAVATVSSNGAVTGIDKGTATITVTTTDGGYTASCIVTVDLVPVTGIILDKYSVSLGIGDTTTIIPTITPANAANKNVNWGSSNTTVATVSSNGTVTAHSVGSSIITATTVDGDKTASCTVTVTSNSLLFYWVDEHNNLVTSGTTTIARGGTLTITAQATGYIVRQWHVNGVNTGQSGNSFNFSSTITGNHTVGLFVEKDGKLYNTNIVITVQ